MVVNSLSRVLNSWASLVKAASVRPGSYGAVMMSACAFQNFCSVRDECL